MPGSLAGNSKMLTNNHYFLYVLRYGFCNKAMFFFKKGLYGRGHISKHNENRQCGYAYLNFPPLPQLRSETACRIDPFYPGRAIPSYTTILGLHFYKVRNNRCLQLAIGLTQPTWFNQFGWYQGY